jgi:aminoglycoside phosphotransferase (APT) family kinase protein
MTDARRVLGEGREAVVYALDESRVLKVFKPLDDAAARARREFDIGSLLFAHGLPVAEPLELLSDNGNPALISRRVNGRSLNRLLSRAPWRVADIAAQLARVQVALHNVRPPAGLGELHDVVEARLRSNPELPTALVARALQALHELPRGDRLCHGNVHLGNVLVHDGGPVLVDCGDTTIGDPHAEVAHTIVRYRCARLRRDVPLLARLGSSIGRRLVGFHYLRAYRKLAAVDDATLSRWIAVRAVERLAEGNDRERRRLTHLATRHFG